MSRAGIGRAQGESDLPRSDSEIGFILHEIRFRKSLARVKFKLSEQPLSLISVLLVGACHEAIRQAEELVCALNDFLVRIEAS